MNYYIESLGYFARDVWLILRRRPLLPCPFCKGKGGAVTGYEEPEWCECTTCYEHWDDLIDAGWGWFQGRIPVWTWVQSKLSIRAGLWYALPLIDLAKCKFGIHAWVNNDTTEPGLRICARCWTHKTVEVGPMEFVYLPGGGMGWAPEGSGLPLVHAPEKTGGGA